MIEKYEFEVWVGLLLVIFLLAYMACDEEN